MSKECSCESQLEDDYIREEIVNAVPDLPAGYFFRVLPTKEYSGRLAVVELRKTHPLFGSTRVRRSETTTWSEYGLHREMSSLAQWLREQGKRDALAGDYPPRTLIMKKTTYTTYRGVESIYNTIE